MRIPTLLPGLFLGSGLFAASLFAGFLLTTVGVAIHPPLVRVAAPLACPDGRFEIETRHYAYKPGQSGIAHQYWCARADGERESTTWRALFFAFLVYSVLAFAALLLSAPLLRRLYRSAPRWQAAMDRFGSRRAAASAQRRRRLVIDLRRPADGPGLEERLRQLQGLHEAGLITAEDYQRRKAELLAEV